MTASATQIRDAVTAVAMSRAISFEEHQAWMRVVRVASEASLLKLARMVK